MYFKRDIISGTAVSSLSLLRHRESVKVQCIEQRSSEGAIFRAEKQ
jgi:hypothetical protein